MDTRSALFLIIYLMANQNESRDHLLRYSAFALIWICQVRWTAL